MMRQKPSGMSQCAIKGCQGGIEGNGEIYKLLVRAFIEKLHGRKSKKRVVTKGRYHSDYRTVSPY
jgi:hypothetical protein